MYPRGDHRVCSLGVPHKKGKAAPEGQDSLKLSHVGGLAAWHDPSRAPCSSADVACRACGGDDKVTLVAKIYAPTDVERSLYVFCCNTRACSLSGAGWRVVRNQSTDSAQNLPATPIESAKSTAPVWSALLAEDDGDDDLEQLLLARSAAMTANKPPTALSAAKGKGKGKGGSKSTTILVPLAPVPAPTTQVSRVELPTALVVPKLFIEDTVESWEEEGGGAHEDELLRKYLQDEAEDDLENMEALRAAGVYGDSTNRVGDGGPDEEDDEYEDEDEARMAGNASEHFFLQRVAREPRQVLRYAYEGAPLWITSPNPLQQGVPVPPCERCGNERVFECQLMPALLSLLAPDADLRGTMSDREPAPSTQADLKDMLGSGLDFGVVAIFSCPLSCPPTHGFASEVAIVQPPPDIPV